MMIWHWICKYYYFIYSPKIGLICNHCGVPFQVSKEQVVPLIQRQQKRVNNVLVCFITLYIA